MTGMLPRIEQYQNNVYATEVTIGPITVFFSYNTPVAFRVLETGCLVVRKNNWGSTTGRHLHDIDGGNKADRVSGEQFEKLFVEAMKSFTKG